jgi:hypothetical protein
MKRENDEVFLKAPGTECKMPGPHFSELMHTLKILGLALFAFLTLWLVLAACHLVPFFNVFS